MRNIKRISAFIIAVALICSSVLPAMAEETSAVPKADKTMLGVLVSLGIVDASDEGFVSREEFAVAVAKLVGVGDIGYKGTLPFEDMPVESPAYGAVGNLHTLGILSTASAFEPQRLTAENEAVKMVVSALGYDDYANAKGGYPVGYMTVASDIDIETNFDGDGKLSRKEMTELLYSALHAEIRYVVIGGGEANSNVTVLNQYHNLKTVEGQITAVDRSSLTSPVGTEFENMVRLDGVMYDASSAIGINNLLGYRIRAYVSLKNSSDKLIYAYENLTENIQTLPAEEAEADFAAFQIRTYNKKYNLSRDYQIIYNGVATDGLSSSELDFTDGEYILVDSDGDGRYDVVNINRVQYVIVDTFTSDGRAVTDINRTTYGASGQTVICLNDDEVFYDFELSDGSECSLAELSGKSTLAVRISQNGGYIHVVGFDNTIKGAVSGVSSDYIEIDGQSYPLTDYAKLQQWTASSKTVNVYLSENGRVIGTTDESSFLKYGYIMAIKNLGAFSEQSAYMLCESGDKKAIEFKASIHLDGIPVNSTEAIADGRIHQYQFVRYQTDAEDKISKIDTESTDNLFEKNLSDDNSLRLYYNQNFYWVPAEKMLTPRVAPVSASIFCVPTAMSTPEGIAAYEFNDGDFFVGGLSDLGIKGTVSAKIYDVTDEADCGAVLHFTDSNPDVTLTPLGSSSPVGVVDKVATVLNADGDAVRQVTIAATTGFRKYYFSNLLNTTFDTENREIKPGDIVRYHTIGDTLTNMRVEFSRENWAMDSSVTDASDNNKNYRYTYTAIVYYHIGTLYNITGSHVLIRDESDNQVGIVPYTDTIVLKYDKDMGSIRPVDAQSVLTECAAGAALANKAVAITRYAESTNLFVVYE